MEEDPVVQEVSVQIPISEFYLSPIKLKNCLDYIAFVHVSYISGEIEI